MSEFKATLLGMLLVISIFGAIGGVLKTTMAKEANDIANHYEAETSKVLKSSTTH